MPYQRVAPRLYDQGKGQVLDIFVTFLYRLSNKKKKNSKYFYTAQRDLSLKDTMRCPDGMI